MAYMSQEMKQQLAPMIKAVLTKYSVKGTISVHNHSSLVVTLKEGALDFIGQANIDNEDYANRRGSVPQKVVGNYQVNPYYATEGGNKKINAFFKELINAMNGKGSKIANHNKSDIQTDYFDVGWYLDINIGKWNKPYVKV